MHKTSNQNLIPVKTISIHFALISILGASCFSVELFIANNKAIQTGVYSFFLLLLLAGIKKETGSMFTMELKTAIQRMIKEGRIKNTEFRSQNSEDISRAILNSVFCLLYSFKFSSINFRGQPKQRGSIPFQRIHDEVYASEVVAPSGEQR